MPRVTGLQLLIAFLQDPSSEVQVKPFSNGRHILATPSYMLLHPRRNWTVGTGSIALVRSTDQGVNKKEVFLVFPKFAVIHRLYFSTAGKLKPELFGFYVLQELGGDCILTCRKVAFLQGPDLDKFCFSMTKPSLLP